MRSWRTKRIQVLAALFAFGVFGGYIVADAIADATHGCASESQQPSGTDDCAVCLTCSHGGALLAPDATAYALTALSECSVLVLADERALDGPPTRIDHPPQLA